MYNFRYQILTILLICNNGVLSGKISLKPRILDVGPTIDFAAGSNITLECEGILRPRWEVPKNEISAHNIMQNVTCDKSIRICTNVLHMTNVQYYQTGLYMCCLIENCKYDKHSSSVYIFINDKKNLLIAESEPISVYNNKTTILPCRPTMFNLNITLWNSQEEYVPIGENVLFDETRGFIVKNPDESYDGAFYCRATYENITQEEVLILEFIEQSLELYPKIISSTDFPVENNTFSLKCSVRISLRNTVLMEWNYPNNNGRIYSKEAYAVSDPDNTLYRIAIKELIVNHAQLSDSGWYKCIVTDEMGEVFAAKKKIHVYDKEPKPEMNLIRAYTTASVKNI